MRTRTVDKENFSFFTGWPKDNINKHITFELSTKDGEVEVKDLSNSKSVLRHKNGYDLVMGGHAKAFIRFSKNKTIKLSTPYAAHPFFVWPNNNGGIIVTDCYSLFAQYGDTSRLNKQYSALRLIGEVAGLHLPFLDTRYLFPSFVYEYSKNGLSAKNILFQIDETGSSIANAFEQVDALYAEYCNSKSHVIASLTGGYDSRFYASMLQRHLSKEQLDFFYVGKYEAHLAASIAKALKSNFTVFDAPDTVRFLRQKHISFYGGDDFYRCSNGLWREEGLYLFNATAAAGRTILGGDLQDDTGFFGMCIESANKGSGYDQSPNLEIMLDRMYVERHPDLHKLRAASAFKPLAAPALEDLYREEFNVLQSTSDRPDILTDLYTYYLTTFPKSALRNGVYAKSGRTYFPLMDERFFNAYLGAPASEKADIGLYRYSFNTLNKALLSLPHQSMDTLKAGLKVSSSGHYREKLEHKMRLKLGLAKKFKGPKRNWKDDKTAERLGPSVERYYQDILPEMDAEARKWMYPYEIYLLGEYLKFMQKAA